MKEHVDKQYEEELKNLKEAILQMGGFVEVMIENSMQSLVKRDDSLAQAVIEKDDEVNRLEMAIDDSCIKMLALRQPAASDLRFITIGLKISKDLERMGDLAVNIAEKGREINREEALKPYVDLPRMVSDAQNMVKQALDSFVQRDAEQARRVCEVDDVVDQTKDKLLQELIGLMQKDTQAIYRAAYLMMVVSHVERIADHATNIAEEVIYMVEGKDIRHGQQG